MSDALKLAQKSLVPVNLFLRNHCVKFQDDFDPRMGEYKLGMQIKHGPKACEQTLNTDLTGSEYEVIRITMGTGARIYVVHEGEPQETQKEALEIEADFIIEYRSKANGPLSQDACTEFANINAIYHVWPYWREFIHSTCHRLSIPSIVLPLYNMDMQPSSEIVAKKVEEANKV